MNKRNFFQSSTRCRIHVRTIRWPSNSWLSVEILWDFRNIPIYSFKSICAPHQIYSTQPSNEAKPLIHGSHRWLFWNLGNWATRFRLQEGVTIEVRFGWGSDLWSFDIPWSWPYVVTSQHLHHNLPWQAQAPVAFLALPLWPVRFKGDMTPKLLHQLLPNNQRHQCSSNEKADTEDLKGHERVPLSSWKFDKFLGSSAKRLLGKQRWPFRRMIAHWFSHFEIQLDPLITIYQRSSAPLIRSASTATSPVACLLQPTWNGQWRSTCGKNRSNRWPNQSKKMLHFVIARIQLQQAVDLQPKQPTPARIETYLGYSGHTFSSISW